MPTLCKCEISVIIPVYNLEKFIEPILSSLRHQKLEGHTVEYIFVLNNCTDRSKEVIENSGLECTIMNCTEQGCGCARNAGFEVSQGKYIWFMDGDDWLLSDTAIKDVIERMDRDELKLLRVPFKSMTYPYQYFSMVWQYVYRRELIEDLRFRKVQPAEDDEFTSQVLARVGYNRSTYMFLPYIKEPLYYYNYYREGSNMRRYYNGENINE